MARAGAALLALLLLPALPLAAPAARADHLDDGSYRCDGGWCHDGRPRVLQCAPDGCVGDVGGFTTIQGPTFGDGAWLEDDDWVIGIEHGDVAKAYPVRIISGQQGWEMVSDEVGGLPVVVTYCPLCGSAIAYGRVLEGQILSFLNTGAIWKWDLVMFDEQTGSQWSQVSGEALDGAHHGKELALVPHQVVHWSAWRDRHPGGLAMDLPRDPDGRALCACPPVDLGRLVLLTGVVLEDGSAYAFPHAVLAQQGVGVLDTPDGGVVAAWVAGTVHVYAARGQSFTLDAGALQAGDGRRFDPATGAAQDDGPDLERLDTRTLFQSRWNLFFPDTTYLAASGPTEEPPAQDAPGPGWGVPVALAAALALARVWVGRRR